MNIDQDIINETTRRYLGKTPDEWAAMEADPSAFHEREVAAQQIRVIVECFRRALSGEETPQ